MWAAMNSAVSKAAAPLSENSSLKVPLRRALRTRSVVPDDVVDQGVVEDIQFGQGVDQPTDVMVGMFQEPGVDLHLPGEHRLEDLGHVVPGLDLLRSSGEIGLAGNTPSSFCRAKISSRSASQPASKRPLYLSDHSGATWWGAWVAPGAK